MKDTANPSGIYLLIYRKSFLEKDESNSIFYYFQYKIVRLSTLFFYPRLYIIFYY